MRMESVSEAEKERRKKLIFDGMSPRAKKHVAKIGFENWDPFQEPKDPIDIRRDKTNRTTQMLVREFLQTRKFEDYSNKYGQGVLDICLGIMNDDDRYIGMFEFSCWYGELLAAEKPDRPGKQGAHDDAPNPKGVK